ncbi:MAG: hypothetical protein IJZ57_02475 [Clostridia bacterium]|nr:hypothetical protein [Clostridia bacterium]
MNKIESYIDSVIPKNIPKSKQQKLKEEIESHIYDRIDFYTEIGYDTDSSINKALADMGEDEATKTSIRNDFEELHYERIWVSVLTGLGMLFLHFWSFFCNWGYYDGLDGYRPVVYGQGDTSGAEYGFITTFIVIMAIVIFYKKEYRKCLITLGVTNLLTIPISAYIYGAIFSLYEVIAFLAVKTMSIQYSVISYDCENAFYTISYCLLICLSLICFGLANKIRYNGKPRKGCKGIIVFCIVYFAISAFTIGFIVPAEKYFYFYPGWFNTEYDMPNESSKSVYNSLDENTKSDDIEKLYGYTTVEKYAKTFDEDTTEKIMKNYAEMQFFFGDDYEVWFDPDFIEEYDEFDGNGFVFIQTDEKGFIKSKGVGNAFSDLRTVNIGHGNIPDWVETFLSYEGGEELESVIDYFYKEYGVIYGEFTTYTESGENRYYRIHCDGYTEAGMWNSKEEAYCDIYIELWFENGALTDGKLHYPDFYYEEGVEGCYLAYNSYYSLAD